MGETLANNSIYSSIYSSVLGLLGEDWSWLAYFIAGFSIILLITNTTLLLGTLYTWFERRLLGRFQGRLGPNRAGPFGILQPIADAVKLLTKEDIMARGVDKNLDAEALRVVKSLPDFTPAKQRGRPVKVAYTVPISFKLQ